MLNNVFNAFEIHVQGFITPLNNNVLLHKWLEWIPFYHDME